MAYDKNKLSNAHFYIFIMIYSQSNINIDEEEVKKGLPMVAGVAIGVLAVAALGVIIVLVRKRMK